MIFSQGSFVKARRKDSLAIEEELADPVGRRVESKDMIGSQNPDHLIENMHPPTRNAYYKSEHASVKNFADRYIPNRSSTNISLASYVLSDRMEETHSSLSSNHSQLLKESLLDFKQTNKASKRAATPEDSPTQRGQQDAKACELPKRIISYKNKIVTPLSMQEQWSKIYKIASKRQKNIPQRVISAIPERILDAPELLNEFYLNLIDWGENGILAVSLNHSLYLWNSYTNNNHLLFNCSPFRDGAANNNSNQYIASVSWLNYHKSTCIAVGFADSKVQIWDAEKFAPIRGLSGHRERVSCLSWNEWMLSTGGKDRKIINHDVRKPNSLISTYEAHTGEVCGLKWSPDKKQLASGGNDNCLYVWDPVSTSARMDLTAHRAAVKAVAWCPWQRHLLASGGGTSDKSLKLWRTDNGSLLQSIDTDSQVCSIIWNKFDKEILTSHGFAKNQLCLWKYPEFSKIIELQGHTNRVLHMALSPDGTTVVSASADETLRFWKVFEAGSTSKPLEKRLDDQIDALSFSLQLR